MYRIFFPTLLNDLLIWQNIHFKTLFNSVSDSNPIVESDCDFKNQNLYPDMSKIRIRIESSKNHNPDPQHCCIDFKIGPKTENIINNSRAQKKGKV